MTKAFNSRCKRWFATAATVIAVAAPGAALHAQGSAASYPNKPIRLVIGFPPGGPNDLIGREVALKLSQRLKQPVVVDNRAGSNGEIATAAVAKTTADGYTLLFGSSGSLAVSPSLQEKLPYDPIKDFSPIAVVASSPMLLLVSANSKYNTVADLLAAAKAKPGALTYGSAGSGSPTHLSAVLLESMASVNALHVPYKGGGPALVDLMGGQIDFYFGGIATALPLVKEGRLKAIGITSSTRSTLMPSVPTVSEYGLPGYESLIWYGVLVPAGTPKEIVAILSQETSAVMDLPDFRKKLADHGAEVLNMGPDQFRDFLKTEIEKWAKVVKATNAKGG
nr:tripartite tricarboxylate transporter substrate binding protein [Rhodoferax sp.]